VHRIGLIIPSSNTSMEPEFNNALAGTATIHSTRIRLTNVDLKELSALDEMVYWEAEKLATAEVDVIVFGCTSGSFVKNSRHYLQVERLVEKSFNIPCVATAGAVIRALEWLRAKKVHLITPYIEKVTMVEKKYLEDHGYSVEGVYYAGILENTKIGRVSEDQVLKWVVENADDKSDAVFISCTNLKTFNIIKKAEETLQKPVISSNSSTLWDVVNKLNIKTNLEKLGTLFQ